MRPCCTNRPGAIGKPRLAFSMEKIILEIYFSTFFTPSTPRPPVVEPSPSRSRNTFLQTPFFTRVPHRTVPIAIGMQTNADAGWQDERRRWPRTVAALGGALTIIVLAAHASRIYAAAVPETLPMAPARAQLREARV